LKRLYSEYHDHSSSTHQLPKVKQTLQRCLSQVIPGEAASHETITESNSSEKGDDLAEESQFDLA